MRVGRAVLGGVLLAAVAVPAGAAPLTPPPGRWVRELAETADVVAAAGTDTWIADDAGITRLDADGGVVSQTASSGLSFVGLAPTADGELYLVATFETASTLDGTAITPPPSSGRDHSVVARLDDDGHLVWANQLPTNDLAVDVDDVPGGGAVVAVERSLSDPHVLAFAGDGASTWRTDLSLGHPFDDDVRVAVDDAGEVALVATSKDSATVGTGPSAITVAGTGAVVARLDDDGTPRWAHGLSGQYGLRDHTADVSCGGDLVVMVTVEGALRLDGDDVEPAVVGLDEGGARQKALVRFDADGELTWAQDVDNLFTKEPSLDVACDGTAHVAGATRTDLTLGPRGDRVVTSVRQGSDPGGPEALAMFAVEPDGTPGYAVVHDEVVDRYGVPAIAIGDLGPRVLLREGDVSSLAPAVGPPTGTRTSVIAFDPAGPGTATPPELGAAFRWARLPDHSTRHTGGLPAIDASAEPRHLAMGPGGQAVIAGEAREGFLATAEGDHDLTGASAYLARVRSDGTLAWARGIRAVDGNGDTEVGVGAVAVGADGSYYVAGAYDESLVLDGPGATRARTILAPPGTHHFSDLGFLARYSANGALSWVRTFRPPSPGAISQLGRFALAATPDGRVVLAITHTGPVRYGPRPDQVVRVGTAQSRSLLAQVGPAGTIRWVRTSRGRMVGVAVDGRGTVREYGVFRSQVTIGDDVVHSPTGTRGWYLARRDAEGRPQQAQRLLVPTDRDTRDDYDVDDLTVDRDGTTYVVMGTGEPVRLLPDGGGPTIDTPEGTLVRAVLAVTPAGRVRWVRRFTGVQPGISDMAPRPGGGVVLGGGGWGGFTIAGHHQDLGTSDLFVVRLRRDGSATSLRDGNSGAEAAWTLGAYPNGDVLVGTVIGAWGTFGANRPEEVNVEDRTDQLLLLRYLGNQL
jgi:hypothetical protein